MLSPMAASAVFTANTDTALPVLPRGSCNFRRLDAGEQAPGCGCQRFWLDDSSSRGPAGSQSGQARAWCFCGHHACFHSIAFEQEESVHGSFSRLSACGHGQPLESSYSPSIAPTSAVPYSATRSVHDNDVGPGRRRWGQVETRTLVPDHYTHIPDDVVGSATEINTPSPRIDLQAHDARSFSVPSQPVLEKAAEVSGQSSDYEPQQIESIVHSKDNPLSLQYGKSLTFDLQNIIDSYARRLDTLENSSFSHVPAEEFQEKIELMDGRLLDLECWRAEAQAKCNNDDIEDGASDSSDHPSLDLSVEASQRLTDMEERLHLLEAAYPSYACPWKIEVVLLPWGESLRGLWVDHPNSPPALPSLSQASEEWNGLASPDNEHATRTDEEVNILPPCCNKTWPMHNNGALIPKAPGPRSTVFKRLQSRGLVQKVTITQAGAPHIWRAIADAFHSFLAQDETRCACSTSSVHHGVQCRGISQSIIPLRKVRRSPYLRFLRSHDMVTPVLWDLEFLKSGIFMKINGSYRLYCTTPSAYVQADRGQWSWPSLRMNLPRESSDSIMASTEQPDCGYLDQTICDGDFWDHHSRLDDAEDSGPAAYSSSVDDRFRDNMDTARAVLHEEHQPVSESSLRASTLQFAQANCQNQSASVPAMDEQTAIASSSKRGISSYEDTTSYQKRRRTSRSTEHDRRLARLTPRWSSEPRSPTTPKQEVNMDSPRTSSPQSGPYSGPQFAYATPHSNGIATAFVDAGGDTEPDSGTSSQSSIASLDSENEWEGVVDDELPTGGPFAEDVSELEYDDVFGSEDYANSSPKSIMMFPGGESSEEEYESLDEGLTIYDAHL